MCTSVEKENSRSWDRKGMEKNARRSSAAANTRSCASSSMKCRKFPRKAANRLSVSALGGLKADLRRHGHVGLEQ